jgi:hypothetical protein
MARKYFKHRFKYRSHMATIMLHSTWFECTCGYSGGLTGENRKDLNNECAKTLAAHVLAYRSNVVAGNIPTGAPGAGTHSGLG